MISIVDNIVDNIVDKLVVNTADQTVVNIVVNIVDNIVVKFKLSVYFKLDVLPLSVKRLDFFTDLPCWCFRYNGKYNTVTFQKVLSW